MTTMKKLFLVLFTGVLTFALTSCEEDQPTPPDNPGDTGLTNFPFVAHDHLSTYVLSFNGTPIDSSITNSIVKMENGDYKSSINMLGSSEVTYMYEEAGILRGYRDGQDRADAGQVLNSQPYDGETWQDEIEGDMFEFTVLSANVSKDVPAGTFDCTYIRQVLVGGGDTVYTYVSAEDGIIELQFKQGPIDAKASLLEKNF